MITMLKKTVYYAIVNEKSSLLLQDCKLPIYWNKTVADERVKLFPGFKVVKVDAGKLNRLLTKKTRLT